MNRKSKFIVLIIIFNAYYCLSQNSSIIFIDQSKSSPFNATLKTEIENRVSWFLFGNDSPNAITTNLKGHIIYGNTTGGGTWLSGIKFPCSPLTNDPSAIDKATFNSCKNKEIKKVIDKMQIVLKSGTENETDVWGAVKLIAEAKAKNVMIISDMIHCTRTECISNIKDEQEAQKRGIEDVNKILKRYSIILKDLDDTKIWIYYPADLYAKNNKNVMKKYWISLFWKLNPTIKVSFLN